MTDDCLTDASYIGVEDENRKARFTAELRQLIETHLGSGEPQHPQPEHYIAMAAVSGVLLDEAKRMSEALHVLDQRLDPAYAKFRQKQRLSQLLEEEAS
jgi:hypothetical protein